MRDCKTHVVWMWLCVFMYTLYFWLSPVVEFYTTIYFTLLYILSFIIKEIFYQYVFSLPGRITGQNIRQNFKSNHSPKIDKKKIG